MEYSPLIDLREATIYQRDGRTAVLQGVDMAVYPGEIVYLVGRVGSGKSSLLKTLYGELPLRKGWGQIAGFSLKGLPRKQIPYLRRSLGIVFQEASLLGEYNVYHNLEFVLRATGWKNKKEIAHRIEEVLHATQTAHKVSAYPRQLSGGERQRVAIARALLNTPQVILADEPTANLDPVSTTEVMHLLHEIACSGCAVLISTHNLSTIRQCPGRTLLLEDQYLCEIDPSEF